MSRYSVEYGREGRFVGLSQFLDDAAAYHDRVADALQACLDKSEKAEKAKKATSAQQPAASFAASKIRRKSTSKDRQRKRPSNHKEMTTEMLKESLKEAMALVPPDNDDDAV